MNIVNKLTLRHIRNHIKRTRLTVLSIIVSVAMVTAVFTTVLSFLHFMQNATIATNGNWHANMGYETMPDLSYFENNDEIDSYACMNLLYQVSLKEDQTSGRSVASLGAAQETIVELWGIRLSAGRYPQNQREILVGQYFLDRNELDWQPGDKITLWCRSPGTEAAAPVEFTVSGIADVNAVNLHNYYEMLTAFDAAAVGDARPDVVYRYTALTSKVYSQIEATEQATNPYGYTTNRDLFAYSGVFRNNELLHSLIGFVGVILAIIVIASVFIIYDSFAVSYQERAKYLGMLASVGATKKQKRASIYFEAFLLGIVGIPLGFAAGVGGIAVTFLCIQDAFKTTFYLKIDEVLRVHIDPLVLLGSVAISALTLWISAYIPARRASKTTAINAIRQTNVYTVKPRKLKTSRAAEELFGFEGALAVKNYRRNAKRSRNIVVALTMSAVMFVSVMNFSAMLNKLLQREHDANTADFTLFFGEETDMTDERLAALEDYLVSRPGIDNFTALSEIVYCKIDNADALMTDDMKRYCEGADAAELCVWAMDNASFDRYLAQLGETDAASYHNADAPKAVLYNVVTLREDGKPRICTAFAPTAAGKTLSGAYQTYAASTEQSQTYALSVAVGAITEDRYDGGTFQLGDRTALILPMDVFRAAITAPEYRSLACYIYAADYTAEMNAAEDYLDDAQWGRYYINELRANYESMNAIFTIAKVFIYGFISLMSLIAVLNIVNTIANSMNERRREFAMIRSIGMTPKQFRRMIYLESLRYGAVSLLWALPISLALHYLMHMLLAKGFDFVFALHPLYFLCAAVGVFVIILLSLLFSADKIRDDAVIEVLREDI